MSAHKLSLFAYHPAASQAYRDLVSREFGKQDIDVNFSRGHLAGIPLCHHAYLLPIRHDRRILVLPEVAELKRRHPKSWVGIVGNYDRYDLHPEFRECADEILFLPIGKEFEEIARKIKMKWELMQ